MLCDQFLSFLKNLSFLKLGSLCLDSGETFYDIRKANGGRFYVNNFTF